jgi:hypothetical protein
MTNKITRNLVSIYWADIHALHDNGTSEIAAYGDEKQQSLGWRHYEAVAWVVPHGEPWDSPNQLFNGQPQWPDDCGHDQSTWYGHVDLPEIGWADLRFFHDRLRGWEYCARYGTGGDYRSFPVSDIASIATRKHYPFATAIAHAFAVYMNDHEEENRVA